ncbi:hypothetical protein N7456_002522 [Penicillium angulare]|uniref:C2H2-type domain-containing protein n=1 Tax=Penicillium angulare TaxID=116970 RepID=A0A9W9G8U6_9EURO|nr:hypothetical protein N7456_002522 [Penicillium angulare]
MTANTNDLHAYYMYQYGRRPQTSLEEYFPTMENQEIDSTTIGSNCWTDEANVLLPKPQPSFNAYTAFAEGSFLLGDEFGYQGHVQCSEYEPLHFFDRHLLAFESTNVWRSETFAGQANTQYYEGGEAFSTAAFEFIAPFIGHETPASLETPGMIHSNPLSTSECFLIGCQTECQLQYDVEYPQNDPQPADWAAATSGAIPRKPMESVLNNRPESIYSFSSTPSDGVHRSSHLKLEDYGILETSESQGLSNSMSDPQYSEGVNAKKIKQLIYPTYPHCDSEELSEGESQYLSTSEERPSCEEYPNPDRSLTSDLPKKFPCRLCSRQFYRREHLRRHQSSVHMKEKSFKCEKCGKRFSRRDNMTQHHRVHLL